MAQGGPENAARSPWSNAVSHTRVTQGSHNGHTLLIGPSRVTPGANSRKGEETLSTPPEPTTIDILKKPP